jgi:endonuclease YncB( thermonuclease family)
VAFAHAAWAAEPTAQLVDGGTAVVAEIVDGDTLRLDREIFGATEVRLVGIQAPKLPLGRPKFKEWPLAQHSAELLKTLTLGRTVSLGFGGQRIDRHGRLLAHLTRDDGLWIQGAMLEAGMARVYSFSDNRAIVPDMLARERAARGRKAGLWADPFYALRTPETAARHINSFELVEGKVAAATMVSGRVYLNFGPDWRSDFTITLAPKTARLFAKDGVDPLAYKGKQVRVRGWLQSRDGPMIDVTHPEQIEVLDP